MSRRKDNTINTIKKEFLQLSKEMPLEKITVRELTNRAHINRVTFYTHYQDIYDLQIKLEEEFAQQIIDYADDYILSAKKPEEVRIELFQYLENSDCLYPLIYQGSSTGHGLSIIKSHYKEAFVSSKPKSKKLGQEAYERFFEAYFSFIISYLMSWSKTEDPAEKESILQEYTEVTKYLLKYLTK